MTCASASITGMEAYSFLHSRTFNVAQCAARRPGSGAVDGCDCALAVPALDRASFAQGTQLAFPDLPQEDHERVRSTEVIELTGSDRALPDLRHVVLHVHDRRWDVDVADRHLTSEHALGQPCRR